MFKRVLGGAMITMIVAGTALAGGKQQEQLMAAAFACSKFAYLADKPDEQVQLLNIGLQTGRRVIAVEVALGKWPPLFKAASIDFMVGMTYADMAHRADNRIRRTDIDGRPLKPKDWLTDPKQVQERAADRYRKENCAKIAKSGVPQ